MRVNLTAFIVGVLCLHLYAESPAQISIMEDHISLPRLFREIKKQSGYTFFYNNADFRNVGDIRVELDNASVEKSLEHIFAALPFSYEIVNKTIVVTKKIPGKEVDPTDGLHQARDLTGKVTDTLGHPLVGATVTLVSVKRSVLTGSRGEFILRNVPEGALVRISFIGYQEKEVSVGKEERLDVVLQSKEQELDEVSINTGYQSLPKERSAGSFSKPEMKVFRQRSGTMNVLQRLDGLIPGLNLNIGATNGDFYPVNIRGLSTIYGASVPLYVVDGIAVPDLSVVNPNDVADVTVLKDATAASIWGARAANGVIVVTTKKGSGETNQLKVDYDMFYSFQGKPDIDVFPMMNSAQYIQTVRELYDMPGYVRAGATDWATINAPHITSGQNFILPHEYLLYGNADLIPAYYQNKTLDDLAAFNNVSQLKELWYRNAALTNHTLSVSGTSGKYGAYASLAYTGQQDATPGNKNNLYQFNARQDYTFNKHLQVYLITNVFYQDLGSKRSIAPTSKFVPYAAFQDENGNSLDHSWLFWGDALRNTYEQQSAGLPDVGQLNLAYNPADNFNSGYDAGSVLNSRLLSGVTVKIWDGLRFEGVYGADLLNNQNKRYDAVSGFDGQVELGKMTVTSPALRAYVPTTGGKLEKANIQQRNWTIRNQLAFDRNWAGGEHQLNVLAGSEIQKQTLSNTITRIRGYDENLLTHKPIDYNTTSAGIANTIINTNATYRLNDLYSEVYDDVRFRSFYANAAYTWLSKYTLNASTRFDESNLFGKDVSAQDKPVWSAGGSWLLSDEPFMESTNWVNRLQVRATYGITGNSPAPGSGGSFDILAPGFAFGVPAGSVNAVTIATPGNSRLTWEQTQNVNAGVDFSVLGNRLNGSIDYYHKHTTNLLGGVPQSAFTGYAEVFGNAGVINNSGLELSLNSLNVNKRNFSWSTQLTFGWNKGKVVKLNTDEPLVYASSIIQGISRTYFDPAHLGLVEGYQPFSLFAYRYAGLDDQGDPQIHQADGTITKLPGVARVEDLVNMGSTTPLVRGGLSNFFRYKQFGLNANIVYGFGFVLRRDVNEFYTDRVTANNYTSGNLHEEFLNRWKQPGDETIAHIPAYDPSADRASRTDLNYYTAADINVIDGNYIKLRDISLSYDLPAAVLGALKVSHATFRVQLNNVMLWRANKQDIDPEFYNGIGARATTYVTGVRQVPFNQGSVTLGAHITF